MSTQEPITSPWLADRKHFAATALYVHMAMAEAECQAPTTNSGLDLTVAAVESARLLLWCAGEASNANIIGAFRRVSRACRRGRCCSARHMLDPTKAFVCFFPYEDDEHEDDESAWLVGEDVVRRCFVSLEFYDAVRMACGAAALGRLQQLDVDRVSRFEADRLLRDPEVRARALAIRVGPMLAMARAHAQCAATYLAGSPATARSNIEESVREYQNPENARSLLEECRDVVRRAAGNAASRRGP